MKNPIHLLAAACLTVLSLGAQSQAQSDSSWDYYWNKNQTNDTTALTPYYKPDSISEARSSYFGMEGAYAINSRNNKIDLGGGFLTYDAYDSTGSERRHQFLFRAGLLKGNKTYWQGDSYQKNIEKQIPLIVGYNYNLAVHDRILLYAGFRGGIVFGTHKINENGHHDRSTDVAALFGAGGGVKFIVTPRMDINLGYEYMRNFTRYFGQNDYNGYHIMKVGVTFGF